jgi:hypothetical protein
MQKITFILVLLAVTLQSYLMAQNKSVNEKKKINQNVKIVNDKKNVDDKILNFYRQYSFYTNPGEYKSMYSNLPDSLTALCTLIKAQMIHPMADLPQYQNVIPKERSCEDLKYPTVETILAGLKQYNPDGLTLNRKPAERLIVTCRYEAILFASILKHKGISVRVRYGFATYLFPGHYIYHVICEVWNKSEQRWMLVDPDRKLVDLTSKQFIFACDAWANYQQGKLEPTVYGFPGWWGSHPILDVLCHDLTSVLGNEHIYFNRPSISSDTTINVKDLPLKQLKLMDKVGNLMTNVDANFQQLQIIYNKNKELQLECSTKAMFHKARSYKPALKKEIKKPDIE